MAENGSDVVDESLKEIEDELLGLTQSGERVNEIQNNISEAQLCCDNLTEQYKKRMMYLRLKHKTRIDDAQAYHRAMKEAKEMAASAEACLQNHQIIMEKLALAKDKLTISVSPETSAKELAEINSLREAARSAYADYEGLRETHATKLLCVDELAKRHRRSIELTREYFDTTESAQKTISEQRQTVELLRKELVFWKERYKGHMRALEQISHRRHLEIGMQGQLEHILQQQISITDTDVASIASFNVDSLEKDVLNEMGSNASLGSGTTPSDEAEDDTLSTDFSQSLPGHEVPSLPRASSRHPPHHPLNEAIPSRNSPVQRATIATSSPAAHLSASLPASPLRSSASGSSLKGSSFCSRSLVGGVTVARITQREENVQQHPLL